MVDVLTTCQYCAILVLALGISKFLAQDNDFPAF